MGTIWEYSTRVTSRRNDDFFKFFKLCLSRYIAQLQSITLKKKNKLTFGIRVMKGSCLQTQIQLAPAAVTALLHFIHWAATFLKRKKNVQSRPKDRNFKNSTLVGNYEKG